MILPMLIVVTWRASDFAVNRYVAEYLTVEIPEGGLGYVEEFITEQWGKPRRHGGRLEAWHIIETAEPIIDGDLWPEPPEPEEPAPTTWGEALGVDEGPAFYAPVDDR